jgi:outer membrane lipoprotein carrier protein
MSAARHAAWVLLAALLPAVLSAQSPSTEELAARVDHHYDSLRSLKASFTESYTGLGMNRSESGTLLLQKPGRMRWDYDSPPGKVFLLDGKYGWFYSPGAPQVQRVPAKELDDLRSPLRFLLGHTDLEKELTGLHEAPDAARPGALNLIGQPKGQEKRVSRVILSVDPATGALTGIEIDETDGAVTRFTFADQKPDAAVPAETFHFTPPPGLPVVDTAPPV